MDTATGECANTALICTDGFNRSDDRTLTHLHPSVGDADLAASGFDSGCDGSRNREQEEEGHQTGSHRDPEKVNLKDRRRRSNSAISVS